MGKKIETQQTNKQRRGRADCQYNSPPPLQLIGFDGQSGGTASAEG